MTGKHDELTPACAMAMQQNLPNAQTRIFDNSSHTPFWEEPAAYFQTLTAFLGRHHARSRRLARRR
jgi:proline iminopeptidase